MSDRVRAHKIAAKYGGDMAGFYGIDDPDDLYIGDAATTATATSALAELLKGGGALAAEQQAKKETERKSKEDEAKQALADKDKNAALADWKQKQKIAVNAQADAHAAQLRAQTEADPNGPLHIAAKKAADRAALAAADAQAAQDKLAYYDSSVSSGASRGGGGGGKGKGGFKMPTWGWILLGTAGAGTLGLIGYKLIKRKRK